MRGVTVRKRNMREVRRCNAGELLAVALEGAAARLCRKFALLFAEGGENNDRDD